MSQSIVGSCLCGGVQYVIKGSLGTIVYCHCQRCRKASGSAFVSSTEILREDFIVTQGRELIHEFANPGMVDRYFCSICGSQLYSQRAATPQHMRLRLGSIDSEFDERVEFHIFTASKAAWHDIHDDAVQYPARP